MDSIEREVIVAIVAQLFYIEFDMLAYLPTAFGGRAAALRAAAELVPFFWQSQNVGPGTSAFVTILVNVKCS